MLDTAPILPKAIKYAVTAHEQTLHRYDGAPYSVHLAMAAHYADMFSYLLPEEKRDYVLSAVLVARHYRRLPHNIQRPEKSIRCGNSGNGICRDQQPWPHTRRTGRRRLLPWNTKHPLRHVHKIMRQIGQRRIFGCFRRRKDDGCLPQRSSAFLFSHKKRPARSRLHTYGKSA